MWVGGAHKLRDYQACQCYALTSWSLDIELEIKMAAGLHIDF